MAVATDRLAEMHRNIPGITPEDVLAPVTFPLGIAASANGEFQKGIFIRDMQRTAEDRLPTDPSVAEKVLWVAAYTQGTYEDPVNDQEPYKVIHEFRDASLLTAEDSKLEEVFEALRHWTHTAADQKVTQVRYYGGYDPTVNHAIIAEKYARAYPERAEKFLSSAIQHIDGGTITIRESVYRSVDWVEGKMRAYPRSIHGITDAERQHVPKFLGYKRMKDTGIPHPIWKDSNLSGIHPDGIPANVDDLIVDTHLQALVITSLISGAKLKRAEAMSLDIRDPRRQQLIENADRWETLALETHGWIGKELWMEEENYPALGQDRDEDRNIRQIKTLTTGGMEILKTAYFDESFWQGCENERLHKLLGIIQHITSPDDFLTEAGPVVMSFRHEDIVKKMGYIPYHSMVSWAKNVKEGIDGLRDQGLYQTALGMSYLLRRSIAIYQAIHGSDYYPEFSYVNHQRGIVYNPIRLQGHYSIADSLVISGTNMPVTRQTWTASAVEAEERYVAQLNGTIPDYPSDAIRDIDQVGVNALVAFIEDLPDMRISIANAKQNPVYIDIADGIRKEGDYISRHRQNKTVEHVVYDGSDIPLVA